MKRFQSRIESLRRLRQQTEKLARLQAAVRQGEKARAEQQVEEVRQHIARLQQMGTAELQKGNTGMLQSVITAVSRAGQELILAKNAQVIAEHQLQVAIQEVARAKADVQIADKHRDKEFAEYRRQALVQEENTRDENNGRRFAARNRTAPPTADVETKS